MSDEDSAVCAAFFAIPRSEVEADVEFAAVNGEQIVEELQQIRANNDGGPEAVARRYHQHLLLARARSTDPNLPEEQALFYATFTAWRIAETASMVANDDGSLAELKRRLREIERREGLDEGDSFGLDEGPDDYKAVQAELTDKYHSIEAAVFVTVLRKYRFFAIANLFETDRATFEVMREVGRRLIFEPTRATDGETPGELWIREQHGEAAIAELRRRLRALGLD